MMKPLRIWIPFLWMEAVGSGLLALNRAEATPTEGPTLGLGYLYDAETNVAEQFALFQLFRDNPLMLGGIPLKIRLADQPYFTDYALTGSIRRNKIELKFWKGGKIAQRSSLTAPSAELADVLDQAYAFVAAQFQPVAGGKSPRLSHKGLLLRSSVNVEPGSGSGLLPGRVPCPVPPTRHLTEIQQNGRINLVTPRRLTSYTDPVQIGQLGEALYVREPESFFLLRNKQIPDELKENIRKLMFPVWSRPGLPVVYLAAAERFEKTGDEAGAISAYQAALVACNNLNTSPAEKAAVKRICFGRMRDLARQRNQAVTSMLMNLAYTFNDRYLRTGTARKETKEYHELVEKIGQTCDEIETQVRSVRAQKRSNGVWAFLNVAAAVTSENADVSEAYATQATDALTQSVDLTSSLQTALGDVASQFPAAYEEAINQMVRDDGEQVVAGRTYLAQEITYHLLRNQDTDIEQILIDFAEDKPRLNSLLMGYVAAPDETTRRAKITDLRRQLQRMEEQAYLYESRGGRVPGEVKQGF